MKIASPQPHPRGANDRHNPVQVRLCRPAVPEETHGDEQGAWDEWRQAVFWFPFAGDAGGGASLC
jgi:hypothetical protein